MIPERCCFGLAIRINNDNSRFEISFLDPPTEGQRTRSAGIISLIVNYLKLGADNISAIVRNAKDSPFFASVPDIDFPALQYATGLR